MVDPIPYIVDESGAAGDAPAGAIPIALFGVPGGGGGGGDVASVNGKTGTVVLDAADVGALPATYTPPVPAWDSLAGKPATFAPTIGTTAVTAVAGNDARLDDERTPTAHTHTTAQVTGLDAALASKADGGDGLLGVTVWDAVEDITSPVTGGIYFVKRA